MATTTETDVGHLGWKFWAAFVGLTLLAGVGLLICFLILGAMWVSWGLLGMLIGIGLIFLAAGYAYDRRQAAAWRDLPDVPVDHRLQR